MQEADSNSNENNSMEETARGEGHKQSESVESGQATSGDPCDAVMDDQDKLLNEDEKESLEEIEEEEEAPIIAKDDSQNEESTINTHNKDEVEEEEECEFVEVKESTEPKSIAKEDSVQDDTLSTKDDMNTSKDIEVIERQSACNKVVSPAPEMQKSTKQQSNSPTGTEKPKPSNAAGQADLASSIWIRNITNTTKAADLKALFTKHGKVLTAKIFTTKNKQNPTCFGYVTLTDPETADLCVENANRLNFKGRVIHVEKADRSNLSQINKNNNSTGQTQQQSKKAEKAQRKSPEIIEVKQKTKATDSKRSSSSGTKQRPRITAASSSKETHRERESGTSKKAPSSHNDRDRRYENAQRSRMPVYAPSRRPVVRGYDYERGYKTPMEQPSTDQQYPVRRIVQTSRGVHITAYPSYNSRSTRVAEADSSYHRSASSHHPASHHDHGHSTSNSGVDKEEMLRLMRKREEEHRKKEEELRMEREREKLKYEREKLEREKLELETYKLHAQLAQAAQLQIAGLPAAAALTTPAAAALIGSTSAVVHNPFIQPHHEAAAVASRRNEIVPAKNEKKTERHSSKDETSTSRRRYAREESTRDSRERRNVHTSDSRGRDGRTKRSRSRSPHFRQESRGGKNDRALATAHRDQRGSGASRYDRYNEEPKRGGIDIAPASVKHQPSQRNDDQYNKGNSGFYYGGAGAALPAAHSREFFSANDRYGNSATDSFNARTDPSYASRIGGGSSQSHQPMTHRSTAEEMFGNAGFSMNLQQQRQDDHYIGQQQYRREQQLVGGGNSSGTQFFQANPSWDASNKATASSSNPRSYISTGSTGVWNSQTDWNTYATGSSSNQQQNQSASGGRFQSSSYGKPGSSSYSTGGRRY